MRDHDGLTDERGRLGRLGPAAHAHGADAGEHRRVLVGQAIGPHAAERKAAGELHARVDLERAGDLLADALHRVPLLVERAALFGDVAHADDDVALAIGQFLERPDLGRLVDAVVAVNQRPLTVGRVIFRHVEDEVLVEEGGVVDRDFLADVELQRRTGGGGVGLGGFWGLGLGEGT